MAKEVDGVSTRGHLEAVWERSGVMPQALADMPKLPAGCAQLWTDFLDLHRRRDGGMGPARIRFADLDAFQRVRGRQLAPWEIEAIERADDAFMASLPKSKAGK